MKKILLLLLAAAMLLLTACTKTPAPPSTSPETLPQADPEPVSQIVEIKMEGQSVTVSGNGLNPEGCVYLSRDIVYYEEKIAYESGNPYGEGEADEMHTGEEAAEHLVVNITAPGTYRLRGKLDLGQIRVDLGTDARENPGAVVNLILDGVDITCRVAPAILFQNVYECDPDRTPENASPDVDTTAAGANLFLAKGSENTVTGSHVAKIFKDQEGEKKLWKQDGAIYSYMSLNVYGPGALTLDADNEGLDTERHLSIHGGDITIRSGNDGINTNEEGVSVTTIWGGNVHITAGLGEEGDGIDSNGYLVIRGGTVVAWAHPAADAGLDSDLGSFIHGGTVIALGSPMDWAESDSAQVTMNLQFAQRQKPGSSLVIAREDGSVVFGYDPSEDGILGENLREYQGAVISCPEFRVGEVYEVFVGSDLTGENTAGIYGVSAAFSGGAQQAYTGRDSMMGPGGNDHFRPGQRPEDMPEPPEGDHTIPQGEHRPPEGENDPPEDGTVPEGQRPPGDFGSPGEENTRFLMEDQVHFFTGLVPVQAQ